MEKEKRKTLSASVLVQLFDWIEEKVKKNEFRSKSAAVEHYLLKAKKEEKEL